MKIAHIVPSFHPAAAYGGPTESVYNLCWALAAAECDIRVLTTNANGSDQVLDVPVNRETRLRDHLTVQYCARERPESVSWTLFKRLPGYIRGSDVVHLEAVYSFPTLPTLFLARLFGKPVVWSPRGALARWAKARHPWLKTVFDLGCRLVRGKKLIFHFTSEPEKEASLRRFPGADGVVIPNGVDVRPSGVRPGDGKALRLLFLGRLDPIKGIENILEACASLNGPLKDRWTLTIAGSGKPAYAETLRKRADALGIGRSVTFSGAVSGPAKEQVFAQADVVVAPSHLENFCIVIAEALARGLPVIASLGTPWSGLESHGCGLWVSNDPSTLAAAIQRIQTMPLAQMGERGRRWMEGEFTWSRIAAQMRKVYEESARAA